MKANTPKTSFQISPVLLFTFRLELFMSTKPIRWTPCHLSLELYLWTHMLIILTF